MDKIYLEIKRNYFKTKKDLPLCLPLMRTEWLRTTHN